jgi:hypothetical protein
MDQIQNLTTSQSHLENDTRSLPYPAIDTTTELRRLSALGLHQGEQRVGVGWM